MTDAEIVRGAIDNPWVGGAALDALDRILAELEQVKAERDAALKLVDDTLLAVGGEPLPEMGQPEYAQPKADPPPPPNPPKAPAHAEDRAPW